MIYPSCSCDCGCEPDGDWHWDDSAGCMCAKRGCPCVIDEPGLGVGGVDEPPAVRARRAIRHEQTKQAMMLGYLEEFGHDLVAHAAAGEMVGDIAGCEACVRGRSQA